VGIGPLGQGLTSRLATNWRGTRPGQLGTHNVTVPHDVHRISITVPGSFDDFKLRYEDAVPAYPAGKYEKLVADQVDWATMLTETAKDAPYNFIRYWSGDFSALMRLSGASSRCVEYLMGNHTIAQRMFIHHPAVMLYAPLRTAIYEQRDGSARFTIEQPSTQFGSFNNPAITEVGRELDNKVALLLEHLGAAVPPALR